MSLLTVERSQKGKHNNNLSSNQSSQASATVGSVTIICASPCRLLMWSRDSLRSLFFRYPSLAIGWYSLTTQDLLHRLTKDSHAKNQQGYKLLLQGLTAEGHITDKQKQIAIQYQQQHSITPQQHIEILRELGWTEADWQRGSSRTSYWETFLTHTFNRRSNH